MTAASTYQVAVHLTAVDNVSGVLSRLSASVLQLQNNVKSLERSFGNLAPVVRNAMGAMDGGKLGEFNKGLSATNRRLKTQADRFDKVRDAASAAVRAMEGYKPVPGSGGGGGGGAHGDKSGAHNMAILGGAAVATGHAITSFTKGLLDASGDLLREVNVFKMSGVGQGEVDNAVSASYRAAIAVPSSNVAENLKIYRPAAGATQDTEGTLAVLPDIVRASRVIAATTGRGMSEQDLVRLMKYVELRQTAIDPNTHKIDPAKFTNEIDWAVKALIASQGMANSNELLQLVKQAGIMAKGMAPQEFFDNYLAIMEDTGGARTGTSLSALGRQVFGGMMTGKVASKWQQAGMLTDQGWHYNKQNQPVIDDPKKAIKGYDILAQKGALAFVEQIMRPAMEGVGLKTRDAQNKALYEFGSTDTARRLISMMLAPEQLHLVQDRLKKVLGFDAFDKVLNGGDYKEGLTAFHESWKTFQTALGDAAGAAPLLMDFSRGLASVANVLKDHPKLALGVTVAGATIGPAATATGTIALGVAGFRLIKAAGALELAALSLGGKGAAATAAGGASAATAVASGGVLGGAARVIAGMAFPAMLAASFAYIASYGKKGEFAPGEAQTTHRMLDALPKADMNEVAKKMGIPLEEGGKKAGEAATSGFKSNDFGGAGKAAGGSLLQGFMGALKSLYGGAGGKTEINLNIDGEPVTRSVVKHVKGANRTLTGGAGFDAQEDWGPPGVIV